MKAILHIGLPKTATTYLQEWLKLNRTRLSAHGIAAISSESSHRLAAASISDAALSERQDVAGIKTNQSLHDAINELQNCGANSAVISSEYFFHCDPADVQKVMAVTGVPVGKIICYIRRQDRISASGYAQEVKALGLARRVADYGRIEYTPLLDWDRLFSAWQEIFPAAEVAFHNFDICGANGSLLDIFRAEIGDTDDDVLMLPERINESLSANLTELVRMMNERQRRSDLSKLMEIQKKTTFAPFSFNEQTTQLFELAYLQCNQSLAARFPERFGDFGHHGWRPNGVDMTDRLGVEDMTRILFDYLAAEQ